ncbi:MAG: chromate transporter [Eubacteriales bacterium]
MLYCMLFFHFFIIGALAFGGGYAALPLIQKVVVEEQGWLTYEEFADVLTLSEVTPGPIALNAASFAGYRTAGFAGSLAATLGCAAPSCLLVTLLAILYTKYRSSPLFSGILSSIRPAICAMILSSFLTLAVLALFGVPSFTEVTLSILNLSACLLFAASLALMFTQKIPPAAVILLSGVCGIVLL